MVKKHEKKIRIFMIILCLLILVWALGITHETDRGLWMGYKWYPIVSSEKVKKEIPYSSASLEQMEKIVDYIEHDETRGKSYLAPGEKINSIIKINKIATIKGFRKFLYMGEPCLYCVYENQSGGKMILTFKPSLYMRRFLYMKYAKQYEVSKYFYYENILSVEDVNNIKEASDREEVLAIDPGVDVKMNSLIGDAYDDERYEEEYLENYEDYEDWGEFVEYIEKTNQQSIHITDNGYLRVQYDLDGRVIKVEELEGDMIQIILEMEQKGITVNLYDVP
ncbi:MAG: hypothetical protein K2K70_02555 [Lachnospiraceae bacterium]|nr:hypothetical protein [Lachnospiraceae bacterium]